MLSLFSGTKPAYMQISLKEIYANLEHLKKVSLDCIIKHLKFYKKNKINKKRKEKKAKKNHLSYHAKVSPLRLLGLPPIKKAEFK